jgi:hypothetical protein
VFDFAVPDSRDRRRDGRPDVVSSRTGPSRLVAKRNVFFLLLRVVVSDLDDDPLRLLPPRRLLRLSTAVLPELVAGSPGSQRGF